MAAPSSADPNTATEHVEKVPLIEVAFKNGMWWALPLEMSQNTLQQIFGKRNGHWIHLGLGRLTDWFVEA